MDLKAFV